METDIIKYSKTELNHNNYVNIAIQGIETSYYSVHFIVKYNRDIFSPVFLSNRAFISEYFDPVDTIYKLYSFSIDFKDNDSEGILISLTPEIYEYEIYLFKDRKSIVYKFNLAKFEGFIKEEKNNNQIYLSRSEIESDSAKNYYIAVMLKKPALNSDSEGNFGFGKYYIGVTFDKDHFILSDQVPHHFTLNDLSFLKYKYFHSNLNIGAYIVLDVFHGECKLSASLTDINNSELAEFTVLKANVKFY